MATIYDVDATELIEQAAEELKKIAEIKPPMWASYVKTGRHKQRPPAKQGWWYLRAASVLRKIYRLGPIGVSKLRSHYGGNPSRGVSPEHSYKGSGNIIRKVLQQLEQAGFLKKDAKKFHKGRVVTPKGKSFLDKIATKLAKGKPVQKTEAAKAESKEKKEQPEETKKPEQKDKKAKKEASADNNTKIIDNNTKVIDNNTKAIEGNNNQQNG